MPSGARGSRRIRVVHCISEMNVGGAEGQLAELICRLSPERFDQALILVRGGGQLLERVKAAHCRVIELGYGRPGSRLGFGGRLQLASALARYRRELCALRPDIVHAQLFWSNILSVAAGRLAGAPAIITSRLALSRHDREPAWMKLVQNVANRFTTAIFANSQAVRRDVLAHERVRPEIVTVIPNGVALERFRSAIAEPLRRQLGLPHDAVALVTVANLHLFKGHDDLLRALALLSEKHPHLHLLLPGRDRGMLPALQALIQEHDLGKRVHLLGERSDIPDLLAASDIVVHPSHEEGFSNAILEGMACGRPVIATNVGGNPEAVRDGVDGVLVPARDPARLAAAIARLASDADLRRRMGEAARLRIEAEFSMERMIERFTAWYESLAAGSAAPRRSGPSPAQP